MQILGIKRDQLKETNWNVYVSYPKEKKKRPIEIWGTKTQTK